MTGIERAMFLPGPERALEAFDEVARAVFPLQLLLPGIELLQGRRSSSRAWRSRGLRVHWKTLQIQGNSKTILRIQGNSNTVLRPPSGLVQEQRPWKWTRVGSSAPKRDAVLGAIGPTVVQSRILVTRFEEFAG